MSLPFQVLVLLFHDTTLTIVKSGFPAYNELQFLLTGQRKQTMPT